MAEKREYYNVSFVYTRAAKGYEGVIIWTSFESKEAFDKWYTEDMKKTKRVVEEGISQERAIELVEQTPVVCRIAAAYEEAKNCSPPGEVDKEILKMELANVALIVSLEKK